MVVVPAGSFLMGAEAWPDDPSLASNAAPQREVTVPRAFAIGRHEITFAQWDQCVTQGACAGYHPGDEGFGRGAHPVLNVSWHDVHTYLTWLSETTGVVYRLPTEAEWEYAARAGTQTPYPWGRRPSHDAANYGEPECPPCTGRVEGRDIWMGTSPVGAFPANAFGLFDTQGNAYEWVQDCYRGSLEGAPASTVAVEWDGCEHRVLRGGAWYSDPGRIRSSYRAYQTPDKRDRVIGFRVARDVTAPGAPAEVR